MERLQDRRERCGALCEEFSENHAPNHVRRVSVAPDSPLRIVVSPLPGCRTSSSKAQPLHLDVVKGITARDTGVSTGGRSRASSRASSASSSTWCSR